MRPQQLPKTKTSSPQPTLRGRALRLLARREFSRQEITQRLRAHAASPAELETLLDDLTARDWLSDARYADALVRRRSGQFARRAIAQELKRAGVAPEISDSALTPVDPAEELAAARALCQRKFRSAPAGPKETARQVRFLQSRGFALSLALRAIRSGGAAGDTDDC